MCVVGLSLLVAFPDIHHFTNWHPDGWVEQALDWQLHHPLSKIPVEHFAKPGAPDLVGTAAHLRKRTYRFTLPLIAHVLGLDLRETEILSALSSVAFSVIILLYFRKLFPADPVIALLLAVSLACSVVGQWGTYIYIFYDGVGYLLLASAAYTERPSLIALFLVAGGFSDERVILAAPLIYLLHSNSRLAQIDLRVLLRPNSRQYGVIAGVCLFAAGRFVYGLHIGHAFDHDRVGLAVLQYNIFFLPLAWVLVFKGATLVTASGFISLCKFRSGLAALLLLTCVLPSIAGSLLVWDLCRSLVYSFPAMLLCAKVFIECSSSQTMRRVAIAGALTSACLPTYYFWEGAVKYFVPIFRLAIA